MSPDLRPELAVIGGSGFYTFLEDPQTIEVETPYGPPSAPIAVGQVDGRAVAFLPRHGSDHRFPAHQVPYRANLWALRSLGVRQILAPCAVGGLQEAYGPGTFVVPDQLVDRTSARVQTYYDQGACHVSFADPYCDRLRGHLLRGLDGHDPIDGASEIDVVDGASEIDVVDGAAKLDVVDGAAKLDVVDGGAMVVIEGPRFSTRAESRWYAAQDWAVINMTGHPEAILARELALCYATVALVTDHDAGVDAGSAVSMDAVFEVFASHTETLKDVLRSVVAQVGSERDCACSHAVDGMTLPIELP